MPQGASNPQAIQEAAKRLLEEDQPTFVRDDGTPEKPAEVPVEFRQVLEPAYHSVLGSIAYSLEAATRLEEAVMRDDKNAVSEVLRKAIILQEGKLTVVEIRSNFYCQFRFCIFRWYSGVANCLSSSAPSLAGGRRALWMIVGS